MKTIQIPHEIEMVRQYDPCLRASCVSPDGRWCLFQDEDLPKVTMWSIEEGKVSRSFHMENDQSIMGGTKKFISVSFSLHFPRKHRTCGDWARRRERRFFDTDR